MQQNFLPAWLMLFYTFYGWIYRVINLFRNALKHFGWVLGIEPKLIPHWERASTYTILNLASHTSPLMPHRAGWGCSHPREAVPWIFVCLGTSTTTRSYPEPSSRTTLIRLLWLICTSRIILKSLNLMQQNFLPAWLMLFLHILRCDPPRYI